MKYTAALISFFAATGISAWVANEVIELPQTPLERCTDWRWNSGSTPSEPFMVARCVSKDGQLDSDRKIFLNKLFGNRNGNLMPVANGNAFWSCSDCHPIIQSEQFWKDSIPIKCSCSDGSNVKGALSMLASYYVSVTDDGDICMENACSE